MGLERINLIKKQRGFTNEQISRISGVPLSTIDKITSGITPDPKINTVKSIMNAMGCTLDDLEENQSLSIEETQIISRFKSIDEYGKKAVKAILDIEYERCSEKVKVFKAACSSDDEPPEVIEVPKSVIELLENAPKADDDDI